ncbi:MAG: helix-turn-helix domain-containing protein [Gaiella sp.]
MRHSKTHYANQRPTLLSVAALAEHLDVSTRTVWRLVAAGEIPTVRVGERIRFRPDDVERYLARAADAEGSE